jgi:polar amino acid transport system substrate-binding protein
LSATAIAALVLTGCGSTEAAESTKTPAGESLFNPDAEALLPDDVRDSGVLTIGTNAPNPPMWFIDENQTDVYTSGTEYELVLGIAEALGLGAEISNQNWDGLMPAVISGRYNMIIGSIGDKPERREQMTFVNYATYGKGLLVRADEAKDFTEHAAMCGKSIGYQTGAAHGATLKQISDQICGDNPIDIRSFADQDAAFPGLSSGQIDAIAIDTPQAHYWAAEGVGGDRYAAVLDDLATTLNYGIGVRRGNDDLAAAIQAAVNGLIQSGAYHEMFADNGIEDLEIDEATINSGQ